jgi:hypothetical protein
MVVLLEFVQWEIGNKKAPKTRAWSDRCTHCQDASGQPNPSPEAGPRIRALALEYVMTFTIGLRTIMSPSHPLIKWASREWASRNARASSEGRWARSVGVNRDRIEPTEGPDISAMP